MTHSTHSIHPTKAPFSSRLSFLFGFGMVWVGSAFFPCNPFKLGKGRGGGGSREHSFLLSHILSIFVGPAPVDGHISSWWL
jgi:hypothetical protein